MCEETGGCLATWDAEDGPKHKTLASHVNDLLGNVHKKVKVSWARGGGVVVFVKGRGEEGGPLLAQA